MHHKDFDAWNERKKKIDAEAKAVLYHTREIWWCSLGTNVGYEQDGTGDEQQRPVLILKGISKSTCFIIPLTTSPKQHKLRIPIGQVDGKAAVALMSQMRLIDTKRLVDKIGFLEQEVFAAVRKAAKDML
jgi:mRNA interferase MazF